METTPSRRRIDVRSELYEELDRQARWLHMAPSALAAMLITEGLERMDREASRRAAVLEADKLAGTPFR